MHIRYCSITGADDEVDLQDLLALSGEYPFAEWAVLLMPAHAGAPRFPSLGWISDFSARMKDAHTAMHLCGAALLGFVEGKAGIFSLMEGFKRIQLNLKFGNVEGQYDAAELLARVRENPRWQFIVQYTPDKAGLLPLLKDIPHHAVLFDASAGRGISPEKWDPPLSGHFCGYAGGLRPDNMEENLQMIASVAKGHDTWIDMETGVRTEDRFDLEKVRRVLEITQAYVQKAAA